jgi:hypothetical protein
LGSKGIEKRKGQGRGKETKGHYSPRRHFGFVQLTEVDLCIPQPPTSTFLSSNYQKWNIMWKRVKCRMVSHTSYEPEFFAKEWRVSLTF